MANLRIDGTGEGIWLGELHVPTAVVERHDQSLPTLGAMRHRQARVPFDNGMTLSIIWGDMTYSSNRDASLGGFTETPDEVEIAVLLNDGDGMLQLPNGDTVMGWVPVADLADLMGRVRQLGHGALALNP